MHIAKECNIACPRSRLSVRVPALEDFRGQLTVGNPLRDLDDVRSLWWMMGLYELLPVRLIF